MVFAKRLGVTKLGETRRYDSRRPFKLQGIGKCIGIGERAPGLPSQEILVLSVKLAQPYRIPVVVAEKVKLEIDLGLFAAVIQSSLSGLPSESCGSHRSSR